MVAALVLPLSVFTVSLAVADPDPTPDDLQKLYTDGSYKELVPKLNKVLLLKGPDAAQYKKYDLLMMKGDACLHLHSKSEAMDAYKKAALATDQPDSAAAATATAELVRQSGGNLTYLRKTKTDKQDKPQPIDIIEPESRKLAMSALETDLAAKAKPKVEQAVKSDSLAAIAQECADKDLVNLKPIEQAANGSNVDTREMLTDLGTRATTLMDAQIDALAKQLDSEVTAVNNRIHPKAGPEGTTITVSQFRQDVNAIDQSATQLQGIAKNLVPLLGDAADMKTEAEKCGALHDAAVKLLAEAKKAGW
jgi:hypothetical protein